MPRLFFAINVPLSQEFVNLRRHLQEKTHYDKIVWVNDNLSHLTLRFIGKTQKENIPVLKKILHEIAQKNSSFDLNIHQLGLFGSHYCPKVIWLGVENQPLLLQLASSLEEELQKAGFVPPEGNFVPHITLGRIKKIDNKKKFSQLIEENQPIFHQTINVKDIILYQSHLEKDGPIYTELCNEPLIPIQ